MDTLDERLLAICLEQLDIVQRSKVFAKSQARAEAFRADPTWPRLGSDSPRLAPRGGSEPRRSAPGRPAGRGYDAVCHCRGEVRCALGVRGAGRVA